ncbi:hypothetical protein SDC9_132554 [bioreactor metagenome]|uniref:Uncharacterized protein n=1 Tax=bioreactor metagenome TaxID=1076179 RepID=A0A645D954_9ZZZZ
MHTMVFNRYALIKPPFHNRVVRSNYDIPKDALCEIIAYSLKQAGAEHFLYAYDGFEQGICHVKKVMKSDIAAVNFEKLLLAVPEGGALGLFDDEINFYIRCSLEPAVCVAKNESQSGIFEFYGADLLTVPLFDKFRQDYDGFFLMESAKKHLDEIFI